MHSQNKNITLCSPAHGSFISDKLRHRLSRPTFVVLANIGMTLAMGLFVFIDEVGDKQAGLLAGVVVVGFTYGCMWCLVIHAHIHALDTFYT